MVQSGLTTLEQYVNTSVISADLRNDVLSQLIFEQLRVETQLRVWLDNLVSTHGTCCISWERLLMELLPEHRRDLTVHRTLNEMGLKLAYVWPWIFQRVGMRGWDKRGLYVGTCAWSTGVGRSLELIITILLDGGVEAVRRETGPRRLSGFVRRNGKATVKFIGMTKGKNMKTFNRCGLRDGQNRQCLKLSGHPAGQCQFEDGEAALQAALGSPLRVETYGDLNALGILVVHPDTETGDLGHVVITNDEQGGIAVRRSPNTPVGSGIDAVATAVRSVGGVVTFGISLMRISTPEAERARQSQG